MLRLGHATAAIVMAAAQPPGPSRPPETLQFACLSNPETRDAVQSHRVMPPFRAVASAMHDGGDLVGIRLCRMSEPPLVYDVAVLRRDGRLVHVIVDGATGLALSER